MNAHLLIDAVVQRTMVFIAELATAGGVRAPLAHVAGQVFLDLTNELGQRGVKKKVIADMFGMALRTYHRRVKEVGDSRTFAGKTVWEAVLGFIREREPVSGREVLARFSGDDAEVVQGVLSDLAHSGLVYRAGRGEDARYRTADEADFASDDATRRAALEHLVWLCVYREGPAAEGAVQAGTHLALDVVRDALDRLVEDGRVVRHESAGATTYTSDRFEVPPGAPNGWEAAVLDHFQAVVSAIIARLRQGPSPARRDLVGGSTWSLDVWSGHPLEAEVKSLLRTTRERVEALRERVDAHNAGARRDAPQKRIVFYAGQNTLESSLPREDMDHEDQ